MTEEQFLALQDWFNNHIRSFRDPDTVHQQSLDLKEEHSRQVVAVMARLTETLDLPVDSRRLAMVIALFHDLGRFRQYQLYRTFRDPDSENHAKLSVRELRRCPVFQELAPAERQLIGRAIIFHNRRALSVRLDPETLFFSRLIRDADKVDILRVMAEHFQTKPERRNPVVTLGLASQGGVREEVYQRLFEGQLLDYRKLTTADEFKVLQMSWVFDINFRPTFEIIREKNDIAAIAASLPDTPIQRKAVAFVNAHIDRILAGNEICDRE